jgi:hypothetical protein
MLLTLVPLQLAHAALTAPLAPNFFLPDLKGITDSANIPLLNATSLDRTASNVFLSNSSGLTFAGTYQQVTAATLNVTVEQINFHSTATIPSWGPEPGKYLTMPISTSANNRFSVNNVQLFPGYNRITLTGLQGTVTKSDIFYVLYDTAPLLNGLQILSNGQTSSLNEGTSVVVTTSAAFIQGSSTNATSVTLNGQKSSVLANGLFFAPAVTLKPGLNNFDIILANATDSITLKRQVYYYDALYPFTIVDVNQGSGESTGHLLGATPTLTGIATTAALNLQFIVPYQSAFIDSTNSPITVSTSTYQALTIVGSPVEQTILDTAGQPAYKLISLTTTPYNLDTTGAALNLTQPVGISISYMSGATPPLSPPITLTGSFSFNLASGQTLVTGVSLLPNYVSGNVTAATTLAPLNGSELTTPSFYVLVNTSKPLALPLHLTLLPLANATVGITAVAASSSYPNSYVYQVTGLPQGLQTLGFSVDTAPVSFTAKVNYVSKNYVSLDNIYDGLVVTIDSSLPASSNVVPLSGKIIGFGNKILGAPQLIINNVDKSTIISPLSTPALDGSYTFPTSNLNVDRVNGPLYYGENVLKFIVNYKDTNLVTPGILRQYIKEVKFYIIDKNVPDITRFRPLTAPTGSNPRALLTDPIQANYLTPSPEFQFKQTYYATTYSNADLYLEGSGASTISIKEGGNTVYAATLPTTTQTTPPTVGVTLSSLASGIDFYGSASNFRLRINNYQMTTVGTHVFTIELTNINGAKATQTLEIHVENVPYRLLSPVPNTGTKIIVNKNFVLFDIEAKDATDVQINGTSATPRTDIPDRYMYTLKGLKGDQDNNVALLIKRPSGDTKAMVIVNYVTDVDVGTMYMEQMGTKHSVFNKAVQLTFPKNTELRRTIDGKLQPQENILFGIARPSDGNTELMNDYGQQVGIDVDGRKYLGATPIIIGGSLLPEFTGLFGRDNFSTISPYYWISAGMGELDKVGQATYREATGGLTPYSGNGTNTETFTNYDQRRLIAPSERGSVTLEYNKDVVVDAASQITVLFLGDNGAWKNLGGTVNIATHTITVPFDNFGYYMVGKLKYGFDDITNHPWARDILQTLFAKGYMPKLYLSEFGANDYTTRGEFAALLVRSMGLKLNSDNNNSFVDIVPGAVSVSWNYAEIETAARAGIVSGLLNRVYAPDLLLTRQDAAVMIARAMNLKSAINDAKLTTKIQKAFVDGNTISYYAKPSVDIVNTDGIMVGIPIDTNVVAKGKQLNFNPTANLTRAEAGQITVKLLQKYLKALPKKLS